ncbi:MAG: O-antigen polymerase [Verrucomicrobia bacterium]|nr:O-antigen polymerase [Verrucomicrobiota bacterium]
MCLGGYRPETMIITSALNGLLLVVHLMGRAFPPGIGARQLHAAGWWLIPFLIYAAINVLCVTPVPWLGWKDWLGWAQMILVFWVVLNGIRSTSARTFLFGALVAVAFAASVLAGYQRFVRPDWLMMDRTQADQFVGRASGSFGIPNSLAALLLLLIPPLLVLTFRKRSQGVLRALCGYLAVTLLVALVLTISRGAWLALALVMIAWPVFAAAGSWQRRVGLTVLATLAVAGAFAALYFTQPMVRERFVQMKRDSGEITRPIMWRGAWKIFREHPAWGGGAGSYNVLFEKFRPENYKDEPVWAHNDYLNTLSDYGAAGFVLFFGVAGVLAWRSLSRVSAPPRDWLEEPAMTSALVAGTIAFALQLFVDFHFKIPALGMAFAIVTALIVQRSWPGREISRPISAAVRTAYVFVALLAAGAVIRWVIPFYRGEAFRYGARQSVNRLATRKADKGDLQLTLLTARLNLEEATKFAPANAQAWADLSYVTSLWGHVEPQRLMELGREAEAQAARALAISEVVPEFWLRRGVALDMQGRGADAGGAFVRALLLAPADSRVWYYHAYHLGLNQSTRDLALAAVNICLRLDPGYSEAQSLRQQLASGRPAP